MARSRARAGWVAWRLALCLSLAGCAQVPVGYYWQSLNGHLQILKAAQPIETWVARPDLSAPLRARLQLTQRARQFAVTELALPDNASYRRYADLQRPAAVWNVIAAPPYSLTLHTWCFPVTGCIGYRGYFNEADARIEAAQLAQQGLEVEVYPVPAYSTLGYLNWAGGDPLLNTFIAWPEGDFVRLMFHELAHQVVYAPGDTAFNESFATAVERLGVERWMRQHASPQTRQAHALAEARRREFRALTQATRARLAEIYESNRPGELTQKAREAMKIIAMEQFRADYAALRQRWMQALPAPDVPPDSASRSPPWAPYDRWVREANNASFAAQAAYHDLVPAFEALLAREGGDWTRFYDAVQQLAQKPQAERHAALRALAPPAPPPAESR